MTKKARPAPGRNRAAFTIVEVLAVVAVFVFLMAMLLPPRHHNRYSAQGMACMNNMKQLALGWILYAQENDDQFMPIANFVGSSRMDWSADNANVDVAPLLTNAMGLYIKTPSVFKCPADTFQSKANPGPRARSVSLNAALGGPGPDVCGTTDGSNRVYYAQTKTAPGVGRGALKLPELIHPGPANVFVTLDEHPDSIDDGIFMFDPGKDLGNQSWRDLPGGSHNGAGCFSFADGHSETYKWLERGGKAPTITTTYPVTETSSRPWQTVTGNSHDYQWMQDRMPYFEK